MCVSFSKNFMPPARSDSRIMINTLMCIGLLHVLKIDDLSSHIATLFRLLGFADLGWVFLHFSEL